MGCQVQLSVEQPYFRTEKVKIVVALHVIRAIVFFALSFIVEDVFMVLFWIGVAELVVGWWFWSLKLESWGISFGVSVFHFVFPATLEVSLISTGIILVVCLLQLVALLLIRTEGGFSYNHIAMLDQAEIREADPVQQRMFQLAVSGQGLKTMSLILGGFAIVPTFFSFTDVIPWSPMIPLAPFIVLLIILDGFATIGLYRGKDWGFHLTLIMVPISFIETMLTLNPIVFLLSVWVLTIFIPCLAKDGFYAKLLKNFRAEYGTVPKK